MAGRLDGKAMIVTGGASGIGAGICRIAAGEGARIMIADINLEAAQRIAGEIVAHARDIRRDIVSPLVSRAAARQLA